VERGMKKSQIEMQQRKEVFKHLPIENVLAKTFIYQIQIILMSQLQVAGEHKASWVTISSDEYESMKATIEAFEDPEVTEQLIKSEEDIKSGRTIGWDSFVKEFKKAKK
jgi:hypothetical protein